MPLKAVKKSAGVMSCGSAGVKFFTSRSSPVFLSIATVAFLRYGATTTFQVAALLQESSYVQPPSAVTFPLQYLKAL